MFARSTALRRTGAVLVSELELAHSISPPWIVVSTSTEEERKWMPSYYYEKDGCRTIVRTLRGRKMRTAPALFDEFAAVWQFPDYFGENWNALSDCLSDIPDDLISDYYVQIINDSKEVLCQEHDALVNTLLDILSRQSEYCATPITNNPRFNRDAKGFHTLLKCPDKAGARVLHRTFQKLCDYEIRLILE